MGEKSSAGKKKKTNHKKAANNKKSTLKKSTQKAKNSLQQKLMEDIERTKFKREIMEDLTKGIDKYLETQTSRIFILQHKVKAYEVDKNNKLKPNDESFQVLFVADIPPEGKSILVGGEEAVVVKVLRPTVNSEAKEKIAGIDELIPIVYYSKIDHQASRVAE